MITFKKWVNLFESINKDILNRISLQMPMEVIADMVEESGGSIYAAAEALRKLREEIANWLLPEYRIWQKFYKKIRREIEISSTEELRNQLAFVSRTVDFFKLYFKPYGNNSSMEKPESRLRWFILNPEHGLEGDIRNLEFLLEQFNISYYGSPPIVSTVVDEELKKAIVNASRKTEVTIELYKGFIREVLPRVIDKSFRGYKEFDSKP